MMSGPHAISSRILVLVSISRFCFCVICGLCGLCSVDVYSIKVATTANIVLLVRRLLLDLFDCVFDRFDRFID